MPARNRVGLSENTRERIKTTMIVKRLVDHIDGKIELKQTQIRAAEILLRKVLPDVQAISHEVSGSVTHVTDVTDQALIQYLESQRAIADQTSVIEGEFTPNSSIPAEPEPVKAIPEATQAPSRHDPAPTDTNAAPKGRKRRQRAHKATPKVEL